MHLSGKLLKSSNVDGTLLRGIEVATAHTEITGGAHHTAGQPQGVVGKDCLGSAIVVLRDASQTCFLMG